MHPFRTVSVIQSQIFTIYNFPCPNLLFIPPTLSYCYREDLKFQEEHAIQNVSKSDQQQITVNYNFVEDNLLLKQHQNKSAVVKKQKNNYSVKHHQKQKTKVEIRQKFGRNIWSNIFRMMINFIKKQKKVKALVQKIILLNNMNIKINDFYKVFRDKCQKMKSYTRINRLIKFWTGSLPTQKAEKVLSKQDQTAKIFRILGKVYLQYSHLPYIYNTIKIHPKSKIIHLQEIHRILSIK